MKTETIDEFIKRGGEIKKVTTFELNNKFKFGREKPYNLSTEARKRFLDKKKLIDEKNKLKST